MTFEEALPKLIELIGGWKWNEDWPWDLGGPARAGIHQVAYNAQCEYVPRDGPRLVADISNDDMVEFYWHRWRDERIGLRLILAEELGGLTGFIFFQLNYLGRAAAMKLLQGTLNAPETGNFDEPTQAAFLLANQFPAQLAKNLVAAQLAYHTFNPIPEPYQTRRLVRVHAVHALLGAAA